MMHEGWTWYSVARAYVQGLSELYDRDVETVAGIVAVLSQRRKWRANCLAAEQLLKGADPGGLPRAKAKALRIMNGEHPELVMKGPKIWAFYRAILGDDDAIVVDSWMARYLRINEKMTLKQYNRAADTLRAEALRLERPPAVHQAIVWIDTRGAAQ